MLKALFTKQIARRYLNVVLAVRDSNQLLLVGGTVEPNLRLVAAERQEVVREESVNLTLQLQVWVVSQVQGSARARGGQR